MAKATRNIVARAEGRSSTAADDDTGDIGMNTKPMDLWVASRVQMARQAKGWSRQRMAEVLGLRTRRRIEKWESGENRMTAAQIHTVARILDVQPGWFFADFPDGTGDGSTTHSEVMEAMLSMPEAVPIIRALTSLDAKQRAAVLTMVRSMAGDGSID